MERILTGVGAISAAVAVAAGAFGAHFLKGRLSPEMLDTFEVGTRYHLIHALAMLAAAWAVGRWDQSLAAAGGWLFLAGTILFSGSLYLLCLTRQRWWGAVTPVGGFAFIAGWICLAWAALRHP